MSSRLTVIMPAYNEEFLIEEAVEDVRREIMSVEPASTLLVVDDGSRDDTGPILDRLAADDGRIRVLHKPNGGHGSAILAGLAEADGEYVMLIDSDRQILLDAFPGAWAQARGVDGVLGVRIRRQDPPLRLALTRIIRVVLRLCFGVSLQDPNVPFKIVRRSAWVAASALIPRETLAPSLFLAIFLKRHGFSLLEVPVPHRARGAGTPMGGWKLLRFCARAFLQMAQFRWRLG